MMVEKQGEKAGQAAGNSPIDKGRPSIPNVDLASLLGVQIATARAFGEISGRMAQAAKDLAELQTGYFKTSQELLRDAFAANRDGDVAQRLARQTECFRELTHSSAKHATDVTEIMASCCCDTIDHMTKMGETPSKSPTQKSAR